MGSRYLTLAALALAALTARPAFGANAPKDDDEDDSISVPAAGHNGKTESIEDSDDDDGKSKSEPKLDQASLDAARATLVKYLDLVKAKKWKEARDMTHPLTLKLIDQVKRRLGAERHSMAPWFWAKTDFYMTSYKIDKLDPAVHGTVIAQTTEDSFQVQEKGQFSGGKAAYLVGKKGGRWYIVDRKSSEEAFTSDSLNYGYPNYFDEK